MRNYSWTPSQDQTLELHSSSGEYYLLPLCPERESKHQDTSIPQALNQQWRELLPDYPLTELPDLDWRDGLSRESGTSAYLAKGLKFGQCHLHWGSGSYLRRFYNDWLKNSLLAWDVKSVDDLNLQTIQGEPYVQPFLKFSGINISLCKGSYSKKVL